jgi:XapX domain-containing protein
MKMTFVSFTVGLGVGVIYGLIRVKSPAPPIVALIGLLGMVLGEQGGGGMASHKGVQSTNAYSARILNERKDRQHRPKLQSVVAVADRRNLQ